MNITTKANSFTGSEIAIIGLSGRFPGAKDIDEFWDNLQNGVESISFFTDEELLSAGISSSILNDPNYVKAQAVLEDAELFDAEFFGFNPREAEITDPQHRIFLECAWSALENAGYDSQNYQGAIGVYAGSALNTYLLNIYLNPNIINSIDPQQLILAGNKDFLTTRVSYKLNLEGPSYAVQTACSTSLVAVHLACQSLLNGECDIALAGGVAISATRKEGYAYTEGGILSPDGHCRAFDADAQGSVGGEGVGIVVLKRLEDALNDRDRIHAVIKGSAINNDGSFKVSYTAPRIDTQAKVIKTAQIVAEVEAETITYVETHGTATALGDPIEIAALTQAFRSSTENIGFCAIGSVKTNIGHLDTAAGVTGLIKTVLALKHKQIPPSLHFASPNPEIDFANSPFYVNTKLAEWETNGSPRRAGVSSFGLGGTNVHLVVEEAPVVEEQGSRGAGEQGRKYHLLVLSTKTESALETATRNLANYLQKYPDLNLADVAYTLQVGRRNFDYRRAVVCRDMQDAVNALQEPKRVLTSTQKTQERPVAFMFSGLGTHYVDMALELYQTEPTFRACVDKCCELLKPQLSLDLRDILYPQNGKKPSTLSAGLDLRKMLGRGTEQTDVSSQKLNQTFLTQPAIFVIEYALAQLWISWGIRPSAMIGYSIGEYVAATLAEVLSLEDALTLVAKRAQMIQELPSGAMLAIALSEQEIKPLLNDKISMSAINGSSLCVIAGFTDAIEELERQLSERDLVGKRLQTSHAFHSVMMEAIAPTFHDLVNTFSLKPPKIPYLSNVTGTWITADQATDPSYWVKHLCQAVCFADGVKQLWQKDHPILLEVGPGQALSSFASQCLESDERAKSVMLPSLRHSYEQQSDVAFLMNTLGRLWLAGVKVDWSGFYVREQRDRIPLPTYPFERQRYWIDANPEAQLAFASPQALHKKPNITDWFYIPSWKRSPHLGAKSTQKLRCAVFIDTVGFGSQVAKQLELQGHDVITVTVGEKFKQLSDNSYAINPQSSRDYDALVKELWNFKSNAIAGWHFVHLWSLIPNAQSSHQFFEECQNLGFYSLLFLAQALGKQEVTDVQILVATNNVQEVNGDEQLCPEKATVLGICKVIPQEYPNITCRQIDVVIPESGTRQENQLIDQLVTEFTQTASENIIAYRGKHRWVQTFEPIQLEEPNQETIPIREGGIYLIVGGLGDVGLVLAEYLAQTARTKLILTGRSGLPPKTEWLQWLATHDDNDDISRKIQKIQALEALGAEVLICRADVANLEQMQAVITQASNCFGEIHGVIHTATVRVYNTVQHISKTECETQLRSTGYGLFVLEKILQEKQLDFCVIISSLASVLGVMGMAAYPAAHIFTDAFVHKHNQTNLVPWLSINYGDWITQEFSESMTVPKGADSMMTRTEGLEVFKRTLIVNNFTQIVTSTVDLQTSIKRWIQLEFNQNSQPASKSNSASSYVRPNLDNAYVAPRSEVEETIAHIWQELLGIGQVGIDDSFFELGGDSVLGIQVSARAAKAGFRLTPQQLFEHQTIAKLAGVITTSQAVQAEQGLVTGSLPLTPIHHRFFERNISEPHHWNQSIFLEAAEVIDSAVLKQAWQQLLLHHDALRLRFKFSESGWLAMNTGYEEIPFTHIDLSPLSSDAQEVEIKTITVQLQTSLNLSAGPIVRVALFDLGANKSSRLLIVAHHLGVDPGSWRVLLEDLQTAYQQIRQGKAIELPPKTTSYKQWALRLEEYANSANLQKAQNYWLSDRHKQVYPLPIDYSDSINNVASEQIVSVTLSAKDTQALLQEVPAVYRTNTQEVLLTAFVQAFAQWTGENSLLVDLEENGREVSTSGIDNVDISRTVGWITTTYPVLLDLEKADNPGDALKVVKEQLRSISGEGLDYGVLRYLSQDEVIQEKIWSIPQAEIAFLYVGQLAKSLAQDSLFQLSEQIPEGMSSLEATRQHKLHLIASVVEGQLQLDWYYSKNVHEHQTIENLSDNYVQALLSLITHCQSLEAGDYTPSDFSAANINQDNLSKLLAQVGQSSRRNS